MAAETAASPSEPLRCPDAAAVDASLAALGLAWPAARSPPQAPSPGIGAAAPRSAHERKILPEKRQTVPLPGDALLPLVFCFLPFFVFSLGVVGWFVGRRVFSWIETQGFSPARFAPGHVRICEKGAPTRPGRADE